MCPACKVWMDYVQSLKDEICYLRTKLDAKDIQIPSEVRQKGHSTDLEHLEPIHNARNWPSLKAELEKKHRRVPEADSNQKYWDEKIKAAENELGFTGSPTVADAKELLKDI